MSSQQPPSNPWLERSRLDGMMLNGFTYGIFTLLSLQACISIYNGRRTQGKANPWRNRILFCYVVVTFILASIGFGANARYTEDIWINFRQGDWDPAFLITDEFNYWYNRMAIDSNYIMVWLMNLLLLYRCSVIWAHQIFVVILMSSVYLAILALSIAVMTAAENHAIFFNLNLQLSFLALSCTYNLLFTTLVAIRLLMARNRIITLMGAEHAVTYTSLTATLIESAALYFVFDLIFVVTFAVHSNVQNLVLLENCIIQAIAQLLIIVRVAKGQEYDSTLATHVKSSGLSFFRAARETTTKGEEAIAVPMTTYPVFGGKSSHGPSRVSGDESLRVLGTESVKVEQV